MTTPQVVSDLLMTKNATQFALALTPSSVSARVNFSRNFCMRTTSTFGLT